ncbi:hypothetical protein QBC38DRAFT_261765 [Podospora fimiseda]|uniref:Secreted protein n=1 Tax=Podospora fimiseda TaxID=252190 RepID=A0AAN7H4X1_9PEZI|nr:hypothetical protein QBC38DRAFT_261765 [Podospora fimiseda]
MMPRHIRTVTILLMQVEPFGLCFATNETNIEPHHTTTYIYIYTLYIQCRLFSIITYCRYNFPYISNCKRHTSFFHAVSRRSIYSIYVTFRKFLSSFLKQIFMHEHIVVVFWE